MKFDLNHEKRFPPIRSCKYRPESSEPMHYTVSPAPPRSHPKSHMPHHHLFLPPETQEAPMLQSQVSLSGTSLSPHLESARPSVSRRNCKVCSAARGHLMHIERRFPHPFQNRSRFLRGQTDNPILPRGECSRPTGQIQRILFRKSAHSHPDARYRSRGH